MPFPVRQEVSGLCLRKWACLMSRCIDPTLNTV